jgi:hypothetical protein
MLTVMSKTPLKLKLKKYIQSFNMKPAGLWYSIGSAWKDWCEENASYFLGKYEYELTHANANILYIKTQEELEKFTEAYAPNFITGGDGVHVKKGIYSQFYVDWPAVSTKYDGIEINPYQPSCAHKYMWYYGWDVSSGCIWNLNGVNLRPIYNYSM